MYVTGKTDPSSVSIPSGPTFAGFVMRCANSVYPSGGSFAALSGPFDPADAVDAPPFEGAPEIDAEGFRIMSDAFAIGISLLRVFPGISRGRDYLLIS